MRKTTDKTLLSTEASRAEATILSRRILDLAAGKSISYVVDYSHIGSKGFSAAYDKNKTGDFDKDGYDQHAAHARLNVALVKECNGIFPGLQFL
jgi:outer membrane cobalamin receptor